MNLGGVGLDDFKCQYTKVKFLLAEISAWDEFVNHRLDGAIYQSDFIQRATSAALNPPLGFEGVDVKYELQEFMVEVAVQRKDGLIVKGGQFIGGFHVRQSKPQLEAITPCR